MGPSSPRSPSRSSRRRSTDWKTSLSTRWRSSRPSLTSSTRPSPRCPDTKHHSQNHPIISHIFYSLQVSAHSPCTTTVTSVVKKTETESYHVTRRAIPAFYRIPLSLVPQFDDILMY